MNKLLFLTFVIRILIHIFTRKQMKLINCLLVSLLLISSPCIHITAQENTTLSEPYFLHTIEKGQSLYSISSMYNVSQADIIRLNPGCDEKIYAGQTLKIPQAKGHKQSQLFHTIQPQETLYQLTVKYGISAKSICDANPGLSANNFRIGEVIVIPSTEETTKEQVAAKNASTPETQSPAMDGKSKCRDMHKVAKKETIFSVSRKYGITEQELIAANPELKQGMKKGAFLCIPYPSSAQQSQKEQTNKEKPVSDNELFARNREESKKISTIKAAIILPFLDETNKSEANRMVEYYEGFLMAVDSLKKSGVSIDLYTYDSGNAKSSLSPILNRKELKEMNIIFGPMHSSHIKPLADFARNNNINLVIPFSSKGSEVFNNPNVYQINTPQSYLYSEVYEHFTRKFPNANVIILQTDNTDKEKTDFIQGLKQELRSHSIPYQSVSANATKDNLKKLLVGGKENIFIPTSGSNIMLIKMLPQLLLLTRENPEQKINLFGYPEWQTYTKDHLDGFYELDTYFYSSFYTNNLFPSAVNFTNNYRKWYGKDMANSYPKFGMLGFDTGYFFLKALSRYGSNFDEYIKDVNVTPIQTGFKFDRVNNWGGFINKKVFFVHFTKDYELVKLDFE